VVKVTLRYTTALSEKNIASYSTPLSSRLGLWISALGEDLLWMGFFKEGQAHQCIQNPGFRRDEPNGWSALNDVLEKASEILPLLCPQGNGRVAVVCDDLLYLSFWSKNQPWLTLGLSPSVDIRRLLAITGDPCSITYTRVAPI